jgi:uncharacterized protein YjlB
MPTPAIKPNLTPLSQLRVSRYFIPAYGAFPNTSIHPGRPLLIYHGCFTITTTTTTTTTTTRVSSSSMAKTVESHLRHIGVVDPAWRYTMYRQHHYHSTTNEVLVVVSHSRAELCFGGSEGKENEGKVVVEVERGDVMVVPAGVGHALLRELGDGDGEGTFEMVGSYPVGAEDWDMCTGKQGEKGDEWGNVAKVRWFERDPVYGDEGPVLDSK